MSINTTHQKKRTEPDQFEFTSVTDEKINVRNHSHEASTCYTVSITDDVALHCTCPDYTFRHANTVGGMCKHMQAVEENLDEIRSDADTSQGETRITGPYRGYDKYGTVDHTYWTCEDCGAEATRKGALTDCC
ncbi:SWIM zinc finger family protein [Haladaptatus sp. CMAA 1911]|uniref:SWIM zinc finger family protein n=1 Tax=unclassified Haladaptatus TaxID=2622732 RepID=UPI0037552224